jgi:PPK2 family polyphosphate:nucleotide phosphotransferase
LNSKTFTQFRKLSTKAPDHIIKEEAQQMCEELYAKIDEFQNSLFANPKFGILILFQGMDASGKDGAIRKLASSLNPQGFEVISFKTPTTEELNHDFLWRIHQKTPAKGRFTFFNRSHYEDVLITRVHHLISEDECNIRLNQINQFEDLLTSNNTIILKFFLDISKDEQRERLDERINNPKKNWKYNKGDEEERKLWSKYSDAYESIFEQCSTKKAPWYCVPADHKWYRDLVIAEIVHDTLKKINL